MRTTAAVCREFGKPLVIEDVQLADPGPGEIRVAIRACAICHSDIYYMEGAWGGSLPAVYGHEAAGIVEATGAGVGNVAIGDHVVVTLIRSCGRCGCCVEGSPVLCETSFPLDRQSPITSASGEPIVHGLRTGAFAAHAVVDASQVVAIPKDLRFDSASLIACGVLTGVGAVTNTARVAAGSTVVVIGTGGVGLNSVQGAVIAGARTIVAVDLSASKLEAARRFGATHTIDPKQVDLLAAVKEVTDGRRADHVFVTVGSTTAIAQGIGLMRRGGSTVIVGMPPSGQLASFDPGWLAADGQRIQGSKMGSARIGIDVPWLVDLYRQGRLKLDELITDRYPLERINEAVQAVTRGQALRNVIVF